MIIRLMYLNVCFHYAFTFSAKGSAIERSIFMGMDEIEAKSCVRFRKKNRNDKKYVLFVADDGYVFSSHKFTPK